MVLLPECVVYYMDGSIDPDTGAACFVRGEMVLWKTSDDLQTDLAFMYRVLQQTLVPHQLPVVVQTDFSSATAYESFG